MPLKSVSKTWRGTTFDEMVGLSLGEVGAVGRKAGDKCDT